MPKKIIPMYKLYSVDDYRKTVDFINNGYCEYDIDDLVEELENNDNRYHMRIHFDDDYILFGDCDGFQGDFEEFAGLLMQFLNEYYDIRVNMKDISYTINDMKNGSFHYSIPKYFGSCEKIKEIHANFFDLHKDIFSVNTKKGIKRIIDTSIYCEKWFRYPNQQKSDNTPGIHVIHQGSMIDFVVELIPIYAQCIDDKIYKNDKKIIVKKKIISVDKREINKPKLIVKKKNILDNIEENCELKSVVPTNPTNPTKKLFGSSSVKTFKLPKLDNIENIDDVENLDSDDNALIKMEEFKNSITKSYKQQILRNILSAYSSDICDYRENWINVGMALKNESSNNDEFFHLWDEWSQQSPLYDGTKINKTKWNSFKKSNSGYSLIKLMSILRTDNFEEYKKINEYINAQKAMETVKPYSKNDFKIENIISTPSSYRGIIADDYCPIIEDEHSDYGSKRSAEVSICGTVAIKCDHKNCVGKLCPEGGHLIRQKEYSQIFLQNINCYGDNLKSLYNIKGLLDTNTKIFEDDKLNTLVIKSLYNEEKSILDAIVLINKNDFCYSESEWYKFDGNIWKKNEDVPYEIITNYLALFTNVKEFIVGKNINGIIKYEYINQVDTFINEINKPKRTDMLIKRVKNKFVIENKFDMNFNLFGFTNGVYDFEKMEFRQGKREDMITLTCGYDYHEDYYDKQGLIDALKNIFPTEKSLDFFMSWISLAICGKKSTFLTIIHWKTIFHSVKLIQFLLSFFGNYVHKFGELSQITAYETNIPDDLSQLESARLVIIKNVKNISENEVSQLVRNKYVEHKIRGKIEDLRINFYTLCMCKKLPEIDNTLKKYVSVIPNLDSDDEQYDIADVRSDFFLLLLEYLGKMEQQNFLLNKSLVKKNDRTQEEKLCKKFIDECLEKNDLHRAKSKDVFEKYKAWEKTQTIKLELTNQQFFKTIKAIDKNIIYCKSLRIDGKIAPGFDKLKIK